MPQTITLYRGEVTLAQNSLSTIFTNTASGTATRLRVGYLSWQSDNPTVYGSLTLSIVRSGGTAYNPVAGTYASNVSRLQGFAPISGLNTQTTGGFFYGSGYTSASSIDPYKVTAFSNIAVYNDNIMVGPSDSVVLSWNDNGGTNKSCLATYCIVGITES